MPKNINSSFAASFIFGLSWNLKKTFCNPFRMTSRIFEGLNNMPMSVKYYKQILKQDATCMEAIACMGVNHFYNDQPEVALLFYR